MKFINISGPRNDIDRVTDLYLSRYEIQLESAPIMLLDIRINKD